MSPPRPDPRRAERSRRSARPDFLGAERGEIQRARADYGQPASAEVLAEISRAKNQLLSPESYEQSARHPGAPLIAAVWRESERELQRCNALCFDDLLANAVRLLSEHPHRVLGSLGLYERTEVRDALAYLTLLHNPLDAQVSAARSARHAAGSARRP